jgi:hypothetical protein
MILTLRKKQKENGEIYRRYLFNNWTEKRTFLSLVQKLVDRTDVFKADFENYLYMFLPLNNSEYTENESGLN